MRIFFDVYVALYQPFQNMPKKQGNIKKFNENRHEINWKHFFARIYLLIFNSFFVTEFISKFAIFAIHSEKIFILI